MTLTANKTNESTGWFLLGIPFSAIALLALFVGFADAAPPGNNWRLIHADEFSGESVDNLKWDTRYQWGRTHNHNAYMRDGNVTVDEGILSLNAIRESFGGKDFTSGVISSHSKFRYTEGYAEMKIKMPSRRGSWPAFWMLDSGWPPEIDVMEYPLFTNETKTDTYSVNSFWGSCCDPPSDFAWIDTNQNLGNDYHTFGLEWTSTQLKYYFDGTLVKTASDRDSFDNMYLIFNFAVGGWPGNPGQGQWPDGATDETHADWLRVWQRVGSQPDSTWTYNSSGAGTWKTAGNWSDDDPQYERESALFDTLAGRSAMQVTWGDNVTVGNLFIDGDTTYTYGEAAGNVANLMFSDRGDGWSRLWVRSGSGGHVINNRLDAWSNLSIKNDGTNPLTINGDIQGQVRHNNDGTFSGGAVTFRGNSTINFNGKGTFQQKAELRDTVTVYVNDGIYQEDTVVSSAVLELYGGRLEIPNLNGPGEGSGLGSLGYLPNDSDRILFDGGKLTISGESTTDRGFTILAGGATIEARDPRFPVVFNEERLFERQIVSNSGGDLELTGAGEAIFYKPLGGNGGLRKTGSGIWTLGNFNSYSGTTEIEAGILDLSGTTGSGQTILSAGAVLQGTGAVSGDLLASGTVAPGQSVGTLGVSQSASFLSGSELEIEITDATSFDAISVDSDVSILSGSQLTLSLLSGTGYEPAAGDSFQFLTSGGALSGEFTDIQFPELEDLNWLLDYSDSSVTAELVFAADFDLDGDVDGMDFLAWQSGMGTTGGAQHTDGDANGDGLVNEADLGIWNNLFGSVAGVSAAAPDVDLDDDGDVDGIDFLIIQRTDPSLIDEWQLQYGTEVTQQPTSAAVPEPSALSVVALGVLLASCQRIAFRNREKVAKNKMYTEGSRRSEEC